MKTSHASLIGLLFIFLYGYAQGQVISLEANANGNPAIKLDGKIMNDKGVQNVPLSKTTGLRFDFSGIKDKTITIRITEGVQDATGSITFDSNYFKVASTLSTDDNLKVRRGNDAVDVTKPFVIGLHSAKSEKSIQCTFVPQFSSSPATQPATSARDTIEEFDEQEEKQYQPGSAVYDALKLTDNSKLSAEELKIIVQYYYPNEDVDDDVKAKNLLDTTPFLKDLKIIPVKANRNSAQSGGNILSSLSASAIGGLDVTAFADGLAKFLVKRTKQELSIAFFDRLKKIIDSTKDLGTLFPNTADHLSHVDQEIYDYERYIQNLREAFKKDIAAIHYTLPGIIDNHKTFFEEHRTLAIGINTGCYIARELENRTHPGDILAAYPFEYLDDTKDITAIGAIKTIQLFSASLRDTTTSPEGNYWVSIGKLRELINNRRALQAYFGLVYREAINRYNRVPYQSTDLATILITVAEKYNEGLQVYNAYKNFVLRLGDKVDALNKMIREYEDMDTDSAGLEKYAKYFRVSVDFVEYCTEAARLPIIDKEVPDIKSAVQKYFDIAYEVTDLVVDAYKRNYSSAINHAVKIYNLVRVKPAQEFVTSAKDKDLAKTDAENSVTVLGRLLKYGSFLATVATAKNSDEVAKAIETAALPVGSSRIKRVSDFNVSLNAYAGLFYGIERIKNFDSGAARFNTFGVSAPIGVGASWGHRLFFIPTGKSEWSTSIYFSLIDVGAVTAFRFRDDSTEQVPTIQLKDIFSPGAFLSIGIPKTALSLNLGAQAGPNLRKVSAAGNDYSNNIYWRYSVSFCVDIPIFNFYTKSK